MREHKFAVGDRVQFLPERTDYSIPRGIYTVVRRLPFERGICAYRVRNSIDGHERVIPEAQLGRG